MLSIEEIKNISFRKASLGGYRPEDVDKFIDQVLITMEQLRKEKSDLIKKMDILATRVEEYRADEDAVRNALLSAQKVADSTVKEARVKAAKILEDAENLAKAKLYDLNVQIKQQKKQYTLLLAEYNHIRDDITNHCNKHISLLKDMPSPDRINVMEKNINDRFPTEKADDYERAEEILTIVTQADNDTSDTDEEITASAEVATTAQDIAESEIKAETAATKDESAHTDSSDINLVDDLSYQNTFYDKKRSKKLTSLKFGEDYDVTKDNGTAESDNT